MNEKILLVIPNSRWYQKRVWTIINYGSLIISGILKDGYDFSILDANGQNLDEDQCSLHIKEINPKIVMVPTLSFEYYKQNHLVLKLAKEACNTITIMGGVYVTTMIDDVMKDENLDYGFIGHAEERIDELIDLLLKNDEHGIENFEGLAYRNNSGGITVNPLKRTIADIKTLVDPDYSKIDMKPYTEFLAKKEFQYSFENKKLASIISSYGCPYNCIFCATRTITGRNIRFRTPDSVIKEIKYLIDTYDVEGFTFVDDCLLNDRTRIEEILNKIIENKFNIQIKIATVTGWSLDDPLMDLLKRAGCIQMGVAIESGSKRVLKDIIRKPLKKEMVPGIIKLGKKYGIDITTSWVIGFPGETWEEIRETFKFAEEIDSDYASFHIATILPKTDLYNQVKELGMLPDNFSFFDDRNFGFAESFIATDEFTPTELKVLRAYEWDRINFTSPEKIQKIATMFNITLDELKEHRKQSRIKYGIHI